MINPAIETYAPRLRCVVANEPVAWGRVEYEREDSVRIHNPETGVSTTFFRPYDSLSSVESSGWEWMAITRADGAVREDAPAEGARRDEQGRVRIIGRFEGQAWLFEKLEQLFEADFDATVAVLRMPLNRIHQIQDWDESSDEIGMMHVNHEGPCAVEIEESVCALFAVDNVWDVTQAMLDQRRDAYRDLLAADPLVETTMTVRVLAHESEIEDGMGLQDIAKQMDDGAYLGRVDRSRARFVGDDEAVSRMKAMGNDGTFFEVGG